MSRPRKFLVIDDSADDRILMSRALLRKFPKAVIEECQDGENAVASAATDDIDAIIVHQLWELDGPSLIELLRAVNPAAPIIAMSGLDRSHAAIAAGATRFVTHDERHRIGIIVSAVLENATKQAPQLLPA